MYTLNTYMSTSNLQIGHQAIHYAAGVGNMAVIKLLIERFKVSVTATDKVHMNCTVTLCPVVFICTYTLTFTSLACV